MNYYVYRHIRLDDNTPFYIGKGCDKRAYQKTNRNNYWKNIVNSVGYKVEIIAQHLTNEEACLLEKKFISIYQSFGLCKANFTSGGEVCFTRSAESRENYRKSKLGNKNPMYGKVSPQKGKKHTPEQIERNRQAQIGLQKGKNHPMYGRKQSDESRLKMSLGKKGKPWSEARRAAHARKVG